MKTIDQVSIRKQNILRVWDLLCGCPAVTRQALADGTGLSLMSVSNLVEHLNSLDVLDFAVAQRAEVNGRRSAGRKAELISLSQERHAWLLLSITRPRFSLTVLTLNLTPLLSVSKPYNELPGSYVDNLRAFLTDARGQCEAALGGREALGAAVLAPAPYDVRHDTVMKELFAPLADTPIKELLRACFGDYDYYVDDGSKFAARAHMPRGADEAAEIMFYLYIGEEVGGAIVHDQNVIRGHNAAAGGVGRLRVDGEDVERTLSLRAFARDCGIEADAALSEETLLDALHRLAADDPDTYRRALLQKARIVGALLEGIVWLLDPAVVVVDCRYARPMEQAFLDAAGAALTGALGGNWRMLPTLQASNGETHSIVAGAGQVLSREWIARVV